jgi:hypothetical protein
MVAGRHRWVEKMKQEGRKFPCGRKLGSRVKRVIAPVQPRVDYRTMTPEEQIAAAREVIAVLRDRLRRTGKLSD